MIQLLSEIAVAVDGVGVPVGAATVNVVFVGQVTLTRLDGGLTVTVGVPVHVDETTKSSTVASSPLLFN